MDAETLANSCRGMFVAMRTHSARAARLTRERDMLLRSREEDRYTLELRAARLRTLAQKLGREADNLYIVEPRAEPERPLKRSHYDERFSPRFPSRVLVASSAPFCPPISSNKRVRESRLVFPCVFVSLISDQSYPI
jgi:hypothetical protein